MQKRFFLQLLFLVLVIVLVGQLAVLSNMLNLWAPVQTSIERHRSSGTIYLLREQLAEVAPNARASELQTIQPYFGYDLRIRALADTSLTSAQLEELAKGIVVFDHESHETLYQLDDSDLLVLSNLDAPRTALVATIDTIGLNASVALLEKTLVATPPAEWQSLLIQLTSHSNLPVSLKHITSLELNDKQSGSIMNGDPVSLQTDASNRFELPAEYFFQRVADSDYAIQVGPITPQIQAVQQSSIHAYLLLLGVIIFLPITLWLIPMWRTSRLLTKANKGLAEGNFDLRVKPNFMSGMAPLMNSFNHTADLIQNVFYRNQVLAHSISHDLRTPLTNLEFNLALLSSNTSESQRTKILTRIKHAMTTINTMSAEIRTYTNLMQQQTPTTLEQLDLNQFVKHVGNKWVGATPTMRVSITTTPNQVELPIDAHWLERCIDNLVRNAVTFANHQIHIVVEHIDNAVVIAVENDGPRITENDRQKIFDPFVRLDHSRNQSSGSTGLGLAIVQVIAKLHSATVYAEDSVLGGARFVIKFEHRSTECTEVAAL